MYRIILLVATLVATSAPMAMDYGPVLERVHGRLPYDAFTHTIQTEYGKRHFVQSLSKRFAYSMATISTILDEKDYGICRFDGLLDTDMVAVGGDYFGVTSTSRPSYEDETRSEYFMCRQSPDGEWKLWASGTCGQAVYNERGGEVEVIIPNVKQQQQVKKCKPMVRRERTRSVSTVPGVSVGGISIGPETYVVSGETNFHSVHCEEIKK